MNEIKKENQKELAKSGVVITHSRMNDIDKESQKVLARMGIGTTCVSVSITQNMSRRTIKTK